MLVNSLSCDTKFNHVTYHMIQVGGIIVTVKLKHTEDEMSGDSLSILTGAQLPNAVTNGGHDGREMESLSFAEEDEDEEEEEMEEGIQLSIHLSTHHFHYPPIYDTYLFIHPSTYAFCYVFIYYIHLSIHALIHTSHYHPST